MKEFRKAESIDVPLDFKRNARRFLYYPLFRTSLPFCKFLEPSVHTTQTKLKAFGLGDLVRADAVKVDCGWSVGKWGIFAGNFSIGHYIMSLRERL